MEQLKVGDLVETCSLIPGFVIYVNPNNPDNIEVQAFDKYQQYIPGMGASHSIRNCNVHKISTKRAMFLTALGNKILNKMWDKYLAGEFDWYSDEPFEKEFNKLRNKSIS